MKNCPPRRYFVEEKNEPYLRMRVGLEASTLWESRHSFAAFDVPVPGSCAIDVHFIIRSADTLISVPEQCRMSLKVIRATINMNVVSRLCSWTGMTWHSFPKVDL